MNLLRGDSWVKRQHEMATKDPFRPDFRVLCPQNGIRKMKAANSGVLLCALLCSVWTFAADTASAQAAAAKTDDGTSQCIPFSKALEKVGQRACVTGKVVDVHAARSGFTYLNFCRDYRDCTFAIVILPVDARRIGNVRILKGREVRITGDITKHNHYAQIIWHHQDQLLVAVDEPAQSKKNKR